MHSDRSAFRSALWSQIAGILVVLVCVAWCGFDATHSRTFAAESTEASIALYADAANFQTGGAIELAIENWKRFLEKYPDDDLASKAAHYLGVCYMQREKPDYVAAAKSFEFALQDKSYELREESLANQGWCYYASAGTGPQRDAEPLKKSIETFEKLRQENPKSDYIDRAYFYSGEAYYGLGKRDEAIAQYNKFLATPQAKDSPLRCDALYARGIAQEELDQIDQAVASYKQMLDLCGESPLAVDVHLRLGDLKISQRDFDAAVQSLQRAIETSQDDADKSYAIFRQAYALVQAGKPDEASQRYDRLKKEFPDSQYAAGATLASGQSLYRAGKIDAAADRFQEVLAQNASPEAATEAAHWLARIFLSKSDAVSAVAVATRQVEAGAQGDFAMDLRVDLAEALSMNPQTVAKSMEVAEQAFRDAPEDPLAPRALYNAAFSALQLNQYDKAGSLATEFVDHFPSDQLTPDVRFILGESRLLTGKAEQALETFQALLKQAQADNPQRPLWVLRTALSQNSLRRFDATIALLEKEAAVMTQPMQKAEAQFLLGQAFLMASRPAEAASAFAQSVNASSDWPRRKEAMLLRGTALAASGESASAEQVWSDLLASEPKSSMADQARYKLAQSSSSAGDHAKAIRWYDEIIAGDRDPGLKPYAIYGRGWSLMQSGQHEQAVVALGRLIENYPNHTLTDDALIARGISHRTLKQYPAAESDLTRYLETKPTGTNLGHALYELALVDQQLGRPAQAAEKLQRLVQQVPNYPGMDKVRYELGWSLSEAGNSEQAAEQFRKMLQQYPETPLAAEAAYFVGQQYYENNAWRDAVGYFRTAVDQSDDADMKEKALYRLGWSFYKEGQLEKAEQAFSEQAEQRPDGKLAIDARMMIGECLFKAEKYEQALASYTQGREMIRQADDTSQSVRDAAERQVRELILLHGGQSAAQLERWDEAVGWYDELKERFPATAYLPQLFYETGFAYQQKGDEQQALQYFEQVADQYRRREVGARARFMMGEIYFAQKQYDKAIPEFQSVMYGFGAEKAPDEIKNWQAKSGFEAGRCSELLMQNARTQEARSRAKTFATQFYRYVAGKHPGHELAKKSAERLEALERS